jgi:hypothetical protein
MLHSVEGRGAQSQLVATEKMHHALINALAPNAEFNIKDVGKDEPGRKDLNGRSCAGIPMTDVPVSLFCLAAESHRTTTISHDNNHQPR